MSTALPEPWSLIGRFYGLPEGTIIAVPSTGLTLFRLVTHDPPNRDDYTEVTRSRAARIERSELGRTGFSHFVTADFAREVIWKESQHVARVEVPPNPRIHLARTDRDLPGHVDAWIPADLVEELLATAEIVE